MSGGFRERLSSILDEIDVMIASCERSMSSGTDQLQRLREMIDRERSDIASDLEQRELERLVGDSSKRSASEQDTVHEEQLVAREGELMKLHNRVIALHNQVSDFRHLLTASRRQLNSDQELPGFDDAQQLAIRQVMIRAKEDERRRLSREVHDGPAQVLANAIIGLEFIERALRHADAADPESAVSEIHRIKGSMREGLSEIRRFIFDLRPNMLAQRGLVSTIEHYVQTYQALLPDEIKLSLPEQEIQLTEEQELTAFRVIQESLQNVHKHAGSTRCLIKIEPQDDATLVTVRDDGRGFDPAKVRSSARGGSGIIGMRERAQTIGAKFEISSAPGSGSEISLIIPKSAEPVEQRIGGVPDRQSSS